MVVPFPQFATGSGEFKIERLPRESDDEAKPIVVTPAAVDVVIRPLPVIFCAAVVSPLIEVTAAVIVEVEYLLFEGS